MSMIGETLGNFALEAQIGKGGMGEVYKAKDQKLGLDVAIKVLPEEFAEDTDRVARFQREAKLLASLNHPNLAAIYGLEESGGTHFLVLELIEGDTLADRIKRGPVPVEEALKLALQIAEALEAAHEKGVIHRDLKPANIKVTPEGKVKVLDFGLAKAFAGEQTEVNLSHSPTLSEAATMQGVILGTAAYMSPEQARGKPVDKRTDIWAFGCVLYEMLTGKAAFQGEDVTETLAAIVKSGVNLDLLPANIHPRIREVITRCPQKEQKKRYGGISEAQYEIAQVLADPCGVFSQPRVIGKPRKKLRLEIPWVTALAILCIIVGGAIIWYLKPTEPKRVMRFDYVLPADQRFTNPGRTLAAVSGDGTKIVYVANRQLYIRKANELIARPIQGSDEAPSTPLFSPDGQWVAYFSATDQQLKKITVSGGASVSLCDTSPPFGATWGEDNTIVFGQATGIMSVSANGGTAELLIAPKAGETLYAPQVLPGGKWVLFAVIEPSANSWDEAQLVAQSIKSGDRKVLVSGGGDARYVPTGHLVYALGGVLYAIPFDAASLRTSGGAVPVVEGVMRSSNRNTGTANYGFSDTGMLVYVVGSAESTEPKRSLVWVDLNGKEKPLAAAPDAYVGPRISPDGTKLALGIASSDNTDIYIWDIARETMTRLTFDEAADNFPLWSSDRQRVAFSSDRGGKQGVYWKKADGTGETELLASAPNRFIAPWAWSGDGKIIVLLEYALAENSNFDIGLLSMEGDRELKLLLHEKYMELPSLISPDGQWMAYTSIEAELPEVFVRPFPDVDKGKWQVSKEGGTNPLWSPDGREIFYRTMDGGVMKVDVESKPSFKLGNPELLFSGNYDRLSPESGQAWDISPDGKKFIMMKPAVSADASSKPEELQQINIVLNWFEELKERVPVP